MKMVPRLLSLLAIASLGFFYTGCGGDDGGGDSVEKTQLAKLEQNTWKVSSVTLEGASRTSDFQDATFKITGEYADGGVYQYAFTGNMPATGSPWQRTGHLKFASDAKTSMVRTEDNIGLTYTVTDSQLTIQFDFSGSGYETRTDEVEGKWIFTFTK